MCYTNKFDFDLNKLYGRFETPASIAIFETPASIAAFETP